MNTTGYFVKTGGIPQRTLTYITNEKKFNLMNVNSKEEEV